MGQPLYFLPNLRAAAAESIATRRSVLKERGLSEVFADVPLVEQPLAELRSRGPGDKPGCILYAQAVDGSIPRQSGYYPSEQAWTPVGDGSLLWIGVDNAEPPKAEEMQRKRVYSGYLIEMCGSKWVVPIIRRHDESTLLPTDMTWNATGQFIEPIKPEYLAYWQETAETAAWAFNDVPLARERALELAVRALGINYRFGRNEQTVMRLIDRTTYELILAATVDLAGFNDTAAAQKKMNDQAAEQSITPGATDVSPTTDQAAAICS